ncbi:hypothetical protein T265_05799 [Opisthorchis viverrini]|uniref:Uncharacterized protein n=1 Tax=Opisthorchis viverrini TaxID=6198 RepID=A0A074ZMX2_OPIVI|nr:hypothetical protein T265_05799 [Opisthorchis viverrini]KER27107.1 hypothetical protein T265_05799 [Opisthorchis viverrini]
MSPRMVTKRWQANCQARRTDQQPPDQQPIDCRLPDRQLTTFGLVRYVALLYVDPGRATELSNWSIRIKSYLTFTNDAGNKDSWLLRCGGHAESDSEPSVILADHVYSASTLSEINDKTFEHDEFTGPEDLMQFFTFNNVIFFNVKYIS